MEDSFYQGVDSLDSVSVNYKSGFSNCFKVMALGMACSIVVCTIGAIFICSLLGVCDSFFSIIAHPSRSWVDFIGATFIYWISFVVVALFSFSTINGYNLVFDNNGIRGTYNNGYVSNGDFISAITVKTRTARYTIYDVEYVEGTKYISWDSFKSFSRYDNYIVLWRSKNPQSSFALKFFLNFNSWLFLIPSECPLKVCGSRSELADLQDFLSQRFPQIRPISVC